MHRSVSRRAEYFGKRPARNEDLLRVYTGPAFNFGVLIMDDRDKKKTKKQSRVHDAVNNLLVFRERDPSTLSGVISVRG